jgi:hypothetical protein
VRGSAEYTLVAVYADGAMGKILLEVWKKTRARLLEAEAVPA